MCDGEGVQRFSIFYILTYQKVLSQIYRCDGEGVRWFSIVYILKNIPEGPESDLHVWQWGGTVVKHFL